MVGALEPSIPFVVGTVASQSHAVILRTACEGKGEQGILIHISSHLLAKRKGSSMTVAIVLCEWHANATSTYSLPAPM